MPPRRTSRRRVAPLRDMALVAERPSRRTGDAMIHTGLDIGGSLGCREGLATTSAEAGRAHTAQISATDVAAARASQLSHSALQGTLAAQLVAKCDDDAQQGKIARLVGGIGTK